MSKRRRKRNPEALTVVLVAAGALAVGAVGYVAYSAIANPVPPMPPGGAPSSGTPQAGGGTTTSGLFAPPSGVYPFTVSGFSNRAKVFP
jgi:hypothetical protein